jgi:hypothetical protein
MSATTFSITVEEVAEDFRIDAKLIVRGDLSLEDAIDVFVAAATEPDEAEIAYESGLTVRTPGFNDSRGDVGE